MDRLTIRSSVEEAVRGAAGVTQSPENTSGGAVRHEEGGDDGSGAVAQTYGSLTKLEGTTGATSMARNVYSEMRSTKASSFQDR